MKHKVMERKQEKRTFKETMCKIYKDRHLYYLLLPALLVTFFFAYCPMPGLVMAFKNFSIYKGIWGSDWVGFENIQKIFTQSKFTIAIWNTLKVSVLSLLITFPAPIVLALLINELKDGLFKRFVQTASYLPHFLSWISVVGLIQLMFSRDGLFNDFRIALGAESRVSFLGEQSLFMWFILGTVLWKEVGWGTVVHLANLSSINPDLYEAAEIDGAKHLQKLWYITLPHMIPTVMILLIFKMGTLFSSNFDLIYGLQNPYIDFEVISTIVYRTGIQGGKYSLSTALGFMEGIVALVLVVVSNWISKKVSGSGLW